jgi:hypothetical protein
MNSINYCWERKLARHCTLTCLACDGYEEIEDADNPAKGGKDTAGSQVDF